MKLYTLMAGSSSIVRNVGRRRRRYPFPSSMVLNRGESHGVVVVVVSSSYLHTNTDRMKKDDPYSQLGIQWGATISEIKQAYRERAQALHPDVNKADTPQQAIQKFQQLQGAYNKLMKFKTNGMDSADDEFMNEWSFAIWRKSDVIAQERTDVAGLARKRPVKPAQALNGSKKKWGSIAALGHPNGGGAVLRGRKRGEYLEDGGQQRSTSSTVGTGQNKWVKKKEFVPWKPE